MASISLIDLEHSENALKFSSASQMQVK